MRSNIIILVSNNKIVSQISVSRSIVVGSVFLCRLHPSPNSIEFHRQNPECRNDCRMPMLHMVINLLFLYDRLEVECCNAATKFRNSLHVEV